MINKSLPISSASSSLHDQTDSYQHLTVGVELQPVQNSSGLNNNEFLEQKNGIYPRVIQHWSIYFGNWSHVLVQRKKLRPTTDEISSSFPSQMKF